MLDSEEFCQLLEDQYSSKLPFVVYRKPGSNSVNGLLQKDDAIYYVLDFYESGFVFAPFDEIEDTILIPYSSCKEISTSNCDFNYQSNQFIEQSEFNQSIAKENHIKLLKKGKEVIKTSVIKKIVLSRFEKVELNENNPFALFGRLIKTYKNAFVYCWFHPKVGLWLGATPESFLKVDGQKFETMSLAGTQLYQSSLDVKWNNKYQSFVR